VLWFTADTHFGHEAIRRHCNRPFASVEEMDDALIDRWNSCVRPKDTIWHLGDFAWNNAADYLDRLNGNIFLCLGNHDKVSLLRRLPFAGIFDVHLVRWEGHRFFVSHYAHRTWPDSRIGAMHLYGHSHGRLPGIGRSMDVGVDTEAGAYAPWSAGEIIAKLDQPLPDPSDVNFLED
jgi:calcineurin-like phosphoesterase family protein